MDFWEDLQEWYTRNGISTEQFFKDNSTEAGRDEMMVDFIQKKLNMTSYEETIEIIQKSPVTYMPAILSETLKSCLVKNVFLNEAALIKFCEKQVLTKAR